MAQRGLVNFHGAVRVPGIQRSQGQEGAADLVSGIDLEALPGILFRPIEVTDIQE